MKANENNGRIFNGSAYIVHRELARAKVHEDKVPVNQVQRVSETMMNLNKVIDEIRTKDWDTTSMESLYRLNSLIREANRLWDYIILMNRECVKCDRLLIQSELNHMLTWVFEESCCNHRDEYMEYIALNNKSNNEEDKSMKTNVNKGSIFNKAAYVAQREFGCAEVHEEKSPINEVWKVCETLNNFRKVLSEISTKKWDTTSMESLHQLKDLIQDASDMWTYICTLDKECVKCNRYIIQAEINFMIKRISEEIFIHHHEEYMAYLNHDNETSTDSDEEVVKKTRPSKDEYYLGIAEAVSARSTCLRIHYGSIICNNDRIVSSGYNGAPMGAPNCDEVGECYRVKNNIPHFTRYETCQSVHSEMNAIINASRTDMLGGTLYLVGKDASSGSYVEGDCCPMCRRAVINAGISQVVFRTKDGGIRKVNVSDWTNDCMFNND